MKLDQLLKIHFRRHTASFYQIRAAKTRFSSRQKFLCGSGNFPPAGASYVWLGRCRPPPEPKTKVVHGSGGFPFSPQRCVVKIKVQWNSQALFTLTLAPPFLISCRPRRCRSIFRRCEKRISALTGHWRGLKKWPTQILSSRQPARRKNRAGTP